MVQHLTKRKYQEGCYYCGEPACTDEHVKFIVAPVLAVLGIYIVGTFIVDAIGIPGAVVSCL